MRRVAVWLAGCLAAGGVAFAQENLARNRPVSSSGPNWGSFKPAALTDGDPASFTHPAADSGTLGFYYEVDLGGTRRFERVVLRNRQDGCCPERLSRFRVEVWSDGGGSAGQRRWSADLRSDGSHSGVAGVDTITAALDPAGDFAGRFVRVVNASGDAYNPQLAEIEIYGGAVPEIRRFEVSEDVLRTGESAVLRWEVVGATSVFVEPLPDPLNSGAGEWPIRPSTSTTYTLVASNEHGSARASVRVGVDLTLAPPELTEFVAATGDGGSEALEDEDGDRSDWIELFNPNAYSLRLDGYFLDDDPEDGGKWPLPNLRLAPFGYLLVYASGKDRREPGRPLHTDFRLAAEGERLALLDRDGTTVLRTFSGAGGGAGGYPPQRAGSSYGLGSGGVEGFMRPPTPGQPNGAAFEGVVDAVVWSHDRGLYDTNALRISLTTATPGAAIRYTTDRSVPSATRGQLVAGPVLITNTTVVLAAAFRPGWAATPVETRTFILTSNVIASSSMRRSITTNAAYRPWLATALREIPSMSLTARAGINDTTEVEGSLEWIPSTTPEGVSTSPGGSRWAPCGVRWFGGAFTDFAKKNFRLYFRSEYGARRFEAPLFEGFDRGIPAVDRFEQLELRSGSHDMEMRGFYLSNAFTDDTLLEMDHLNPHGRFVHLYLQGSYWGVYHLRERWGASMHRSYRGGEEDEYESINGNWNVGGWAEPGEPYDGDGSTWARIKALRADYPAIQPWLDVPQFVDFMLMWMFGGAEDEYRCVGTSVPGAGFQFYLNDADGWLCIPQYCAAGNRTARGAPGRQAGDGPGSLFSMLHAAGNPEYRMLLADRIQRALGPGGALGPERNRERLTRRAAEFERPFLLESARWGYLTPAAWTSRRDSVLNSWFPRRTSEALAQFRAAGFSPALAAPELLPVDDVVPAGTAIGFRGAAGGTVVYTLDGTDPRLPGGAVSPSARSMRLGDGGTGIRTLVPAGAVWRWHTDAAGLGSSSLVAGHASWSAANWKHPDYDDSSWATGRAELGYGEGDEATTLPFGNAGAKWTTAYFRRSFVVDLPAPLSATSLRLKCDDGAIVYVDGVELARHFMPEGAVDGTSPAQSSPDDGQTFSVFEIPASRLSTGTHAIAVELHQASPTTSDASFDLEWIATGTPEPPPPAFRIEANTLVKARVFQDGAWSARSEEFYRVGSDDVAPGDLVVREIAFRPRGTEDAEFVEIENVAGRAVNLAGVRFGSGVGFLFPSRPAWALAPGQRALLVDDLVRFRRQYGWITEVAGVFSGRLDDQGERLRLMDSTGRSLLDFRFGIDWPWPDVASGDGFTLVLSQPLLGLDQPAAWRASVRPGGTPGTSDAEHFAGFPDEDTDGDGLSAIVEYALGTDPADPASGRNTIRVVAEPDGWLSLRVARNAGADDVDLRVEASFDLRTWLPSERRGSDRGTDGSRTDRWDVPVGERGAAFLRLRVVRFP